MIDPRAWHWEDQVEVGGSLAEGLCQMWQWKGGLWGAAAPGEEQ